MPSVIILPLGIKISKKNPLLLDFHLEEKYEMGFIEIVIVRDLSQTTVFYEGFDKIKKAH